MYVYVRYILVGMISFDSFLAHENSLAAIIYYEIFHNFHVQVA